MSVSKELFVQRAIAELRTIISDQMIMYQLPYSLFDTSFLNQKHSVGWFLQIIYKKTDEWYNEWQQMATGDNKWQEEVVRIRSSLGQLLSGTATFLTEELLRRKISTEEPFAEAGTSPQHQLFQKSYIANFSEKKYSTFFKVVCHFIWREE